MISGVACPLATKRRLLSRPFYLSEFAGRVLYFVALFADIAVCGYVQKNQYFLISITSC